MIHTLLSLFVYDWAVRRIQQSMVPYLKRAILTLNNPAWWPSPNGFRLNLQQATQLHAVCNKRLATYKIRVFLATLGLCTLLAMAGIIRYRLGI